LRSASTNWAPEPGSGPDRDTGADGTLRSGVVVELPWQDPATAFLAFQNDPYCVWFDAQGCGERARTSTLCVSPFEVHASGSPFAILDEFLKRFGGQATLGPTQFAGGAAGFIGYECASLLERVPRHPAQGIPDFCIGFYDVVLAWDHQDHRSWLISSGLPETGAPARLARARARAKAVLRRLQGGGQAPSFPKPLLWRRESPRGTHEWRVARARAYIHAGDIFQANIAARFSAPKPRDLSPAAIHLALRAENPAPYGAYLACGDHAIASVSPERFIGVSSAGEIETRPIKGTARRAQNAAEDLDLARALLASSKDRAENLMIVDLLRHDIGRVARFGSVHVPELARLESFPHVHHLVSSVRGTLRAGANAADLMRAAFPGGSITGAPKIRAMEIIHELEPASRGPYCGSVFWLGADGAMDGSIAIRTATITPHSVIIQAGGGIVADSDPAAEYEEVMIKAGPLLRALGVLAE